MNIKDDITNKTINNLQRSRELIHKKDDKTASYNVYSYPRLLVTRKIMINQDRSVVKNMVD